MCILNLFSDRLHIVVVEEKAKIVEVKMRDDVCLAVQRTSLFGSNQMHFIF